MSRSYAGTGKRARDEGGHDGRHASAKRTSLTAHRMAGASNPYVDAAMRAAGGMRRPPRMESLAREIKFVDNALTNTDFRTAATPPVGVYIGGPVQGAAPYQRVGQKLLNKSLQIRGIVVNKATSTEDIGRILIVYDRQPNGAVPVWSLVVASYIAAGTSASTAYDGLNMNNRERFKVLADEQLRFPAVTNTSGVLTNQAQTDATGNTGAAKWNFERFIRLKDMPTHFNATNGGGIGDVTTGSLVMFCVSQSNDACWTFNWSSRLRFDDL